MSYPEAFTAEERNGAGYLDENQARQLGFQPNCSFPKSFEAVTGVLKVPHKRDHFAD
jgi:hypothetical protein